MPTRLEPHPRQWQARFCRRNRRACRAGSHHDHVEPRPWGSPNQDGAPLRHISHRLASRRVRLAIDENAGPTPASTNPVIALMSVVLAGSVRPDDGQEHARWHLQVDIPTTRAIRDTPP
ncbi:MAG: hypothetical protein U0792_09375 [Gemmataceae bacterium]